MYHPCKSDVQGSIKRRYEDFEQEGSADTVTTRKLSIGMLRNNAKDFQSEVRASEAADAKHRAWSSKQYYQ